MLQSTTSELVLLTLVHTLVLVSCQRVLVVNPTRASAVFNLKGVTGQISFTEEQNITTIAVNLQGLRTSISQWSIRQLPADNTLSPTDRCSEEYLGGVYDNAIAVRATAVGDLSRRFGSIDRSGTATFTDTQRAITLQGSGSIVGRALLLQVGTGFVCATIRSASEDAVTLRATLISPAAGVIYFRQSGSEPTIIHGKLYWIDTTTTSSVQWAIYDDPVAETYRAGFCGNPNQRFDDLTGRHGELTVSSAPQPYGEGAFLFTDNVLMLSGLGTIEGRTLVLSQGGNVITCAPIVMAEPLGAVQYPSSKFQISQTSPHESSTLTMSADVRSSYTYSILDAAWMTNRFCPASGEVYNPLDTTPPANNANIRTPDMFPNGDISGKFGAFTGPSQQLNVTELPTYGRFSTLGLTMREVNTNGYRSCSALVPLMDDLDNTVMAKAAFTEGTISGAMYFIQKQNPISSGQPGMTNIIVDLYYNDPTASQTTGHNWHVHVDLPQPGVECAFAVGWHFNPFNVDLGDTYGAECGIDAPLRCESGDLSGKHGKLIFSPLGPNRRIEAYVDPNLQLLGEYKIIGRSIGLHMSPPNTVLFSCAEVKQVEMNSQKYDVMVAFPEPANFERVAFIKELLELSAFEDILDPSDVLIVQEQVGAVQSVDSGTVCASTVLKIMGSSVQQANTIASTLQNSLCVSLADNGCMSQLPGYDERLCVGASGAERVVAPFSAVLIVTGVLMHFLL